MDQAPTSLQNEILDGLPLQERDRLRPELHPVTFVMHQVLHESGIPVEHVYFPLSGLVSLTARTDEADFVEFGVTGRDGFVGVAAALDIQAVATHRAAVQIPGSGYRLRASLLQGGQKAFPVLSHRCKLYVYLLMVQTAQNAACNARHDISARLARWLLVTHDRTGSDDIPMKQDFLSQSLGVRQASVSTASKAFQTAGLIRQSRGRVIIDDRAGLEREACSCYRLLETTRLKLLRQRDLLYAETQTMGS